MRQMFLRIFMCGGVLLSIFPFSNLCSQTELIPLIVRDNGSGLDTITFGVSRVGTRCIDPTLGEQELPPTPLQGVFDVRWGDPAPSPNSDCMGNGLKVDIRSLSCERDTFKLVIQPGDGGFPIHISWPENLNWIFWSAVLQDPFGGVLVNVDMLSVSSYDLTNPAFSNYLIYVEYLCPDVREEPGRIPQQFRLRQNYPNPFNPITTIRFDIPIGAFAEIDVFDLLGNFVKHLVSQDLHPSAYSTTWDGSDNSGNAVASGAYLVRLRATPTAAGSAGGTFTATQKVLLTR